MWHISIVDSMPVEGRWQSMYGGERNWLNLLGTRGSNATPESGKCSFSPSLIYSLENSKPSIDELEVGFIACFHLLSGLEVSK